MVRKIFLKKVRKDFTGIIQLWYNFIKMLRLDWIWLCLILFG